MGRIIRIVLYTIFLVFAVCQVPFVQKQIVKYMLPSSVRVAQMRSYGIFPIYLRIPTLVLQKDQHDFVSIKNGVLDLRYLLLRRQVAFDAEQLIVYKQLSQPEQSHTGLSVGDVLAQFNILTFFHDFNINSFQYKDGNKVQFNYKIDWDLKLSRVKLHAKRNDDSTYPSRIEIDGTTKKENVEDGQIKIVLNDGLNVDGTFTMKSGLIKTNLFLQYKGRIIATIQPMLDLYHIDSGLTIESLNLISPFFQLAGCGHVSANPTVATVKNNRFFLGLANRVKNAVIGKSN